MKHWISLCFYYDIDKIIAGHGQFEINMTKAMFKLLWDLAKMLGFISLKALAECQSASGIIVCNILNKTYQSIHIVIKLYISFNDMGLF